MAIQSIRGVVEAAIQSASTATGVDFGFMLGTARRESGYNPAAKAATSSAAGLYQFTEQTWLATLKKFGPRHGYARYADMIQMGADGRYHTSGDARATIMNLRMDPRAASLMAGEMTSDSAAYLKGRTGRSPTAGELYAAHFLGPQGSARLIEAVHTRPGATAAQLFPDAAHANKTIFYRDGRAATVGEVYANLTRAAGSGPVAHSPDVAPANEDGGFIQYASARNLDRQQQQQELISLILRGAQPTDQMGVGSRLTGSMFTSEMLRVLSDSRKG